MNGQKRRLEIEAIIAEAPKFAAIIKEATGPAISRDARNRVAHHMK